MNFKKSVNILGTKYNILYNVTSETEPLMDMASGYCDTTSRTIVIRKPGQEEGGVYTDNIEAIKRVIRHEIVHAFLLESGLDVCAPACDCWARCEEVVDWIGIQGPKIYKAWEYVGVV